MAEGGMVASRHGLRVTFLANSWIPLPRGGGTRMQAVTGAFDAANDWIVELIQPGDIVVTADIPLASRCLQKGARVLGPSGEPFTDDNIGDALAGREPMAGLRAYGVGGGPPPFSRQDRSRYLQALELLASEVSQDR